MAREYAGTDLAEIREALRAEGFTETMDDRGERGFDVWRPFGDLPSHACVHAVVWLRDPNNEAFKGRLPGYWVEEY